ncbi:DUF2585 domain-containing protein [Hyphomicrobium sp. DY-1]|uniref:DUF2585 domain-containing protein n=1 Tax=Hyphomicrobium sp. DY-1 TaxID=3075650 RepID=UPI0039C2B093
MAFGSSTRVSAPPLYVFALLIVLGAAVAEYAMGRVPICTCGTIKLWHGAVQSSENSQHLADWYTFTHIVHGYLFYFVLWLVVPRWSIPQRFLAAVAVESLWEVLENSSFIIDRYRTATFSFDYYGDSIVNSMSDIAAMAIGFAIAARLPVAVTVLLGIASEALMAYAIRDNLVLNIIMLIHPIDAIKAWQAAAPR